jgi:uncharacterized repeat protein (TIGR02543 family)
VVIPASATTIQPFAFTGDDVDFFFLGPSNPTAGINAFGFAATGTAYVTVAASASGGFPLTGGTWEGLIVQTGSLVNYDGNGATTGTTPTNVQPLRKSGIPITVASNSGGLDKFGHIFAGWNTAADGSGFNYLATGTDSLTPSGNVTLYAKWVIDPAYVAALAAAADLAARTISAKKKYVVKSLAKRVGVTIVSSKATVSFKVSKSSKNICTKSGSKLKTLKAGNCIVTFTVQEPKPKKGKKPKATKTVKTLVVQ